MRFYSIKFHGDFQEKFLLSDFLLKIVELLKNIEFGNWVDPLTLFFQILGISGHPAIVITVLITQVQTYAVL